MKKIVLFLMMLFSAVMYAEEIPCSAYVSNYSGGEWMFALTSTDGKWLVTYYIQIEKDNLQNGVVYQTAQLQDSYANYLSNPQNPSATPTTHTFTECTFSVTLDEQTKTGVLDGTFVSKKDGNTYHVAYSGAISEPVVPPTQDSVKTSKDDDATRDLTVQMPAVLATPYTQPMFNEIEVRGYSLSSNEEVSIVFIKELSDFDEVTYAPAGVYEISDSHELGTVYAGQGHTLDNSACIGTYAAQTESSETTRWYITSGSVMVENNDGELYIHLVGTNSNGKNVDIEIGEKKADDVVEIGSIFKKYYPVMKSWSIVMTTAANEDIRYVLDVDAPATMASGVEYKATGSWDNQNTWENIAVQTGTYREYTAENGDFYEEAILTLVNGEEHHPVHVTKATPTVSDTVLVELPNSTMRIASNSVGDPVIVFAGASAGYDVSLSFIGGALKSSYKTSDIYAYYTHLAVNGEQVEVRELNATASESETGFLLDAFVTGDDSHCYHTILSYALPEAKDTIDFAATNMLIDESKINHLGEVIYSASNGGTVVELWIETESVTGHFTRKQIDYGYSFISNDAAGAVTNLLWGDVTVAQEGLITHLTGAVLTEDAVYYRLDITYSRPAEPSRELTLEIEDAVLDRQRVSEEGVLSLVGLNLEAGYNFSLVAYIGAELEGDYTEAQFDLYDTFMQTMSGSETYDLLEAKMHVSLDPENDLLIVTGTFFMQGEEDPSDAPLVHLTMSAFCPTGRVLDNAEEDFSAVLHNYVINDELWESNGIIFLDAADKDTTKMLALAVYTYAQGPMNMEPFSWLVGEYEISDSALPGTVAIAPQVEGGQLAPSFAATTKEDGEPNVPLWYLMSGKVKIYVSGDKLSVEVDALNSYKREVHVWMNVPADTVEIDMNDCELAGYEDKFQFLGQSTSWEAFVALNGELAEGHYTWKDAIAEYCHVRAAQGGYTTAIDLEADVKKARNGYDCDAYLTCTNNVCYHILFHYYNDEPVAEPFETVRIEATNLSFDNVWVADGYWIYEASNDSVVVTITAKVEDPLLAAEPEDLNYEFTYITNKATGSILRCYSGETAFACVEPIDDTPGYYALSGYLLGKDGVRYNLWLDQSHAQGFLATKTQKTSARKILSNGQLVIEYNGVKYNTLGQIR